MSMNASWRTRLAGIGVLLTALASSAPAQVPNVVPTTTQRPDQFGTSDYVVTVIPASAFTADTDAATDFGSLYRYFPPLDSGSGDFFYGVNVPSGAVIDFVGLQTQDNGYNSYQATLYALDWQTGATSGIVSVDFGPNGHIGFATAYNTTALGWQLVENRHNALVMAVHQSGCEFCHRFIGFGWVEIWWKRTVSPAPDTPSFADVPASDFGYQYIEALKASGITGGCGTGTTFCPDAPLTRRQMAIFLSKALGLHWPY